MDDFVALTALVTLLTSAWDILEWLLELPGTVFHGYRSLIRSGADAARSLFEDYGYWVVFFGTLLENTLFVGLIVPGALVIILAGLSVHDGSISAPIVIGLGAVGTIIGDTISYCLGRFGWSRFGHGKAIKEFEQKIREPLLKRGALFVLVYHFAGYTRLFGPAAAGFLKMPYRRWAIADYLGACLWVTTYLAIGYGLGMAGVTLDSTDDWFRYFEWGLLLLVGIWGYFLYKAGLGTFLTSQLSPEADPEPDRTSEAPRLP